MAGAGVDKSENTKIGSGSRVSHQSLFAAEEARLKRKLTISEMFSLIAGSLGPQDSSRTIRGISL